MCLQPLPAGRAGRARRAKSPASDDARPRDVLLSQYYTRPDVAALFVKVFREHFDMARFLMVEPSAGTGSFLLLLPFGSLAYDVDPKHPGIRKADFLGITIPGGRPIAVIGNPPFGRKSGLAIRFFNHAARQADVIAFIFPRSIRKASFENKLDRRFHLIREVEVPKDAFLFRSKPYDVQAVFQIWERRSEPRRLRPVATTHPDFEFTTHEEADFAIQRVGAQAGRIHHDFTKSESSHYFIKGKVEHVMARLDFASVVGNVAGNPSLAKSEIVRLYSEFVRLRKAGPPPGP